MNHVSRGRPTQSKATNLAEEGAACDHVVVLIHGIRDRALWQKELRDTLTAKGFKVEPTNYEYIDAFTFLIPIGYFRKQVIERVEKQIRMAIDANRGAEISVIAHSFGTFVFASILKRNFDMRFKRVIFCGSVVKYDFPFEQLKGRFEIPVLNEVGTRDMWPAVAASITWGYGSAGTYGFRRPLVYDRWHNGAGHGYFLDSAFCEKFWIPFLRDGTKVPDDAHPESPAWWVRLLSLLRPKYLGAIALLWIIAPPFVSKIWPFTWIPSALCSGLPGETAWIYAAPYDAARGQFKSDPGYSVVGSNKSPQDIEPGDWIRLLGSKKTMILDYAVRGTARATDSPFSLNGSINYTCKSLSAGEKLYVADKKVNGPYPSENHIWLRVRLTPPGS